MASRVECEFSQLRTERLPMSIAWNGDTTSWKNSSHKAALTRSLLPVIIVLLSFVPLYVTVVMNEDSTISGHLHMPPNSYLTPSFTNSALLVYEGRFGGL
jgi:hypothetical protein